MFFILIFKGLACVSQQVLKLTNVISLFLNERKKTLPTFAQKIAFGITLSFERYQDCGCFFKTN